MNLDTILQNPDYFVQRLRECLERNETPDEGYLFDPYRDWPIRLHQFFTRIKNAIAQEDQRAVEVLLLVQNNTDLVKDHPRYHNAYYQVAWGDVVFISQVSKEVMRHREKFDEDSTEIRYIVTEKGLAKQYIETTPVTNQEEINRALRVPQPTFFLKDAMVPAIVGTRGPWSVYTDSQWVVYTVLLQRIPFACNWKADPVSNMFYPSPLNRRAAIHLYGKVPVVAEREKTLFFQVAHMRGSILDQEAYACQLIGSQTYQIPLPNVYDNGRVCIGTDFSLEHGKPKGSPDGALKMFMENTYNNDLTHAFDPQLLRVKAIDGSQSITLTNNTSRRRVFAVNHCVEAIKRHVGIQ